MPPARRAACTLPPPPDSTKLGAGKGGAIEAAFTKVQQPWAMEAFARFEEELSRRLEAHATLRAETCGAAERRALDGAAMAAMDDCLSRGRRDLEVLGELLSGADEKLLARSLKLLHDLPSAESCRQPAEGAQPSARLPPELSAEVSERILRARLSAEAGATPAPQRRWS